MAEATTNTVGTCPAGYTYVVDVQVGSSIFLFWAKKPAALKCIESPVMFPNMAYLYTSDVIGGHPRLYLVRKVTLAQAFTWASSPQGDLYWRTWNKRSIGEEIEPPPVIE